MENSNFTGVIRVMEDLLARLKKNNANWNKDILSIFQSDERCSKLVVSVTILHIVTKFSVKNEKEKLNVK